MTEITNAPAQNDPEFALKRKKQKKDKKDKKAKLEPAEAVESVVDTQESIKRVKKEKKSKNLEKDSSFSNPAWSFTENCNIKDVSKATIDAFLTKNNISFVESETITEITPILEFKHLKFPSALSKSLSGFTNPTPIQSISWPIAMQGQDLVGIAATGSGKTLAFGIPALLHVYNKISASHISKKQTQVLVLSPTRELAMQIHEQLDKFGSALGISSICLYGGVNKWEQKKEMQQKGGSVNIIIATPGRLMDLVSEEAIDLSHVSFFVLDEADRMLDLGFEQDIIKIVKMIPAKNTRQTVMFSATWPNAIQKLSGKYLSDPVRITVGSTDLSANTSITQHVEVIDNMAKDKRLLELLREYHSSRKNRVLVFCLYKKEVSRVEQFLQRHGYHAMGISGDVAQHQRSAAIANFRDGSCPLLIATDVAARGLDIPNVEYVINYTYPLTTEEYCHRIGRTGRAGKTGIAHTLFTVIDKAHSGSLINVLKQAGQNVPDSLMAFGTTVKKKLDPNYGAFAKDVDFSIKATKITFGSDSE